jgi:hypothetical protein
MAITDLDNFLHLYRKPNKPNNSSKPHSNPSASNLAGQPRSGLAINRAIIRLSSNIHGGARVYAKPNP